MIHRLFSAIIVLLTVTCGVMAQAPADAGQPPTLEDLFDPPANRSFALSPSGRQVSFVETYEVDGTEPGSTRTLSRIRLRDLTEDRPDQVIEMGVYEPQWLRWTSEDRFIVSVEFDVVYTSRRNSENTRTVRLARLLAVPVADPSAMILLLQTGPGAYRFTPWQTFSDVVDMLPDDPDHVMIAAWRRADYSLWKVNLNTGEPEIAAVGNRRTLQWITNLDGEPVLRFDITRDGGVVQVRAQHPRSGRWRVIEEYRLDRINDAPAEFEFAGHSEDDEIIYVVGRPEGADRRGVYRYSLAEMNYLEQVGGDDHHDVAFGIRRGRSRQYAGYVVYGDRVRVELTDPVLASALDDASRRVSPESDLAPIDLSGSSMILAESGPRLPRAYHAFDLASGEMRFLANGYPQLSDRRLRSMEAIRYRARDGLEVQAYLTLPERGASPSTPLLVMPHGGPVARDIYGFDRTVQFYTSLGYAVLQPNFRGSSGFGAAYTRAGYQQWGRAMQDDLDDGVQWLVDRGITSGSDVCIVGWSYGGYAALVAATRPEPRYRCAIAGAPVSDLFDQIDHWYGVFEDSEYMKQFVTDLYGDPEVDEAYLSDSSPIRFVENISIPVLIHHGDEDERVPVDQSRAFADRAEAVSAPVTYHEYEGELHTFDREPWLQALRRDARFLATHLPTAENSPERWPEDTED